MPLILAKLSFWLSICLMMLNPHRHWFYAIFFKVFPELAILRSVFITIKPIHFANDLCLALVKGLLWPAHVLAN